MFDIADTTVRQTLVPDRQLGRVTSTFFVAGHAAQLAATLAAGILAEAIGLRATLVFAPIGALIGALVLWRSPVRTLIRLPEVSEADRRTATSAALVGEGQAEPFGG